MLILVTKANDTGKKASTLAASIFGADNVITVTKDRDLLNDFSDLLWLHGKPQLISFLGSWVVPSSILDRSTLAINFHPGSSDYPGIGCYNFALYEGATEYGCVCHHMLPKVDSGKIIEERRFPVFSNDTVESLKLRTTTIMLAQFHDILFALKNGDALPTSNRSWSRPAFTRRQLNELGTITPQMDASETLRRVRAMHYPGFPGASIPHAGVTFESSAGRRKASA